MIEQLFKMITLLFKLMVLIHIYSHLKIIAEASGKNYFESIEKCEVGVETGLKNKMTKNETNDIVLERPIRPARLLPLRIIL